jgi:hypothetical protein
MPRKPFKSPGDFMKTMIVLATGALVLTGSEARAQEFGAPVALAEGVTLDPILVARLRYETVDQASLPNAADALTLRARVGAELKASGFSLLMEGEGTVAVAGDHNDTLPGNGIEPFPVVADPKNLELNRLQVSYLNNGTGMTLGRQRITLDNQRFVGAVGWRQNEQTFDAVRGQAKLGPVALDATWSISQRTVFGVDSPNAHFDGDLVLLNAGVKLAPVQAKAFAYLLDYDTRLAFSSQTYGVLATAGFDIPGLGKLTAQASHARQSDFGSNPVSYEAEYWNAQLALGVVGFTLTAGYEELGSDRGVAAFQTPLATLHAFNGWADLFLSTPANGLRDYYVGIGRAFAAPFVPGLRADFVYHKFESDFGGLRYGSEWNASLGFELGRVGVTAKYANYDAAEFGVDTEKFWLQAEVAF